MRRTGPSRGAWRGAALAAVLLALPVPACAGKPQPAPETEQEETVNDPYTPRRHRMVETQLEPRGITDPVVLKAMREVPRHVFMPPRTWPLAYGDHPVGIGHGQTISQPYIVAYMSQLADLQPGEKVLEVGTGSGYQAAVLAAMGVEVYTIEIVPELGRQAAEALEEAGYDQVHTRIGDGYVGWPEAAPFDAVVITAAPPEIPEPLVEQLAVGGRMVVPVGDRRQELVVLERTSDGTKRESMIPVMFVPMTGKAREKVEAD